MKNLYKRFSDLTGRSLRTVVTCVSSVNGESVLQQYPGGALVRVRGEGTPEQRYFVRDDALDGEAPTLVGLEIEV